MKKAAVIILAMVCVLSLFACTGGEVGTVDATAPTGMKLASGDGAYFKMYVPQDWIIDSSTGTPCAYVSEIDPTSVSAVRVAIAAKDAPEYWAQYSDEFSKSFTNYTIVTDGENMTVSGHDAKKYVYTASLTGVNYKYCTVICVYEGSAYILTYTANAETYDANYESFSSICDSFMIKTGSIEK